MTAPVDSGESDSALLDAAKPHAFHGLGSSAARMLAVVCS